MMTMRELLEEFPWARRTLFQKFHIGGCASCGFSDEETLEQVCARNGNFTPEQLLEAVREAHAADEALMLAPRDVREKLADFTVVDIRSREEFEAVSLPGSHHFTQDLLSEILTSWDKTRKILLVDHVGHRALDAAAFFAGHGFSEVKCLRGGIDAYSQEADPSLPRYVLE